MVLLASFLSVTAGSITGSHESLNELKYDIATDSSVSIHNYTYIYTILLSKQTTLTVPNTFPDQF